MVSECIIVVEAESVQFIILPFVNSLTVEIKHGKGLFNMQVKIYVSLSSCKSMLGHLSLHMENRFNNLYGMWCWVVL